VKSRLDLPAAGLVRRWRVGSREILLDQPIVMGILNVTPDSFSDGGNFFSPDQAVEHASQMLRDGADIIDVGGESTRPGATVVGVAEEIRRVVPVIRELKKRHPDALVSIDTVNASVASAAIDEGAEIINDVSAMRLDAAMPLLAAKSRCGVVLMHSRGTVENMASYDNAVYDNVTTEVIGELASQLLLLEEAGVDRSFVAIDPGFGFSKRSEQSFELLGNLGSFAMLAVPLMVGVSRKRFLTEAMLRGKEHVGPVTAASLPIDARDAGTVALNVVAILNGATIFRVHNVAANRRGLDAVWTAAQSQSA
jgi:dihydropteroate synthase